MRLNGLRCCVVWRLSISRTQEKLRRTRVQVGREFRFTRVRCGLRQITLGTRSTQEAQLSLINRPTLVHVDVSCCAVLYPIYWPDRLNFTHPLTFHAPSEGIPSSYRVHIWCKKTRMAGLQSGEGRMMIDSVVWAQYINVTDTQTATSP